MRAGTRKDRGNGPGRGPSRVSSAPVAILVVLSLFITFLIPVIPLQPAAAEAEGPRGAPRATGLSFVTTLSVTETYEDGTYEGMFPLLVQNLGDAPASGTIDVTGLPAAGWYWAVIEGQEVLDMVEPGDAVRVSLRLHAEGPVPGTYGFAVLLLPGGANISLEAVVPLTASAELWSEPEAVGGHASGAWIEVGVRNRGNGPDRFALEAVPPYPDWHIEVDPEPLSPVLAINETFTWTVHVSIPLTAEASPSSAGYRVLFKAVSQGDPDTLSLSVTHVMVTQYHGLLLEFEDEAVPIGPEDDVMAVDLHLENLGNGHEEVSLVPSTPAGWKWQISDDVVDMYPFQRKAVTLLLSPDIGTVAGCYTVSMTASASGVQASDEAVVSILDRDGLHLEGQGTVPTAASPGDTVTATFHLSNTGNHIDIAEIFLVSAPAGWTATASPSMVSLNGGAGTDIAVAVTTSEDPLGSLAGSHTVVMGVRGRTGAEAQAATFVEVSPVARLAVDCDRDSVSANPVLDPSPVLVLSLRNLGNTDVTASLEFEGEVGTSGWLQPSREAVTLLPGETAFVHAIVAPPFDAPPGTYAFWFRATGGGSVLASTPLTLEVLQRDVYVQALLARKGGSDKWTDGLEAHSGDEIEVMCQIGGMMPGPPADVTVSLMRGGRTVGERTIQFPPGGSLGVVFHLKMDEGLNELTARAEVVGDYDPTNDEAHLEVRAVAAEATIDAGAVAVGFSVTTALILSALVITNEGWRFKALLLLVVPLYTRINKERTLDNFTRGRIYGYIEANPGVHLTAIGKAMGISNGCLTYHLDKLEKEGFVRSTRDGTRKFYYPKGMRIDLGREVEPHPAMGILSKVQEAIIERARREPGISQRQMASAIGVSPSTVNYNIRLLAMAGILRLERHLGRTRCFAQDM